MPSSAASRPSPESRSPRAPPRRPASASTRSGRRASARSGRPSAASRRSSRPPTYPVAPVISSMELQCCPKFAPLKNPLRAGPSPERACKLRQTRDWNPGRGCCSMAARAEDEARPLRGLLLPPEPALRAEPRQALHDLPARRARARARAPARFRLPHASAPPPPTRSPSRTGKRPEQSGVGCADAANGAGQVALLAGRRRRLLGLPARGGRHRGAARLRQRRVRRSCASGSTTSTSTRS